MNPSHAQNLQSLARRLRWLFMLRAAVEMATVWLFCWGVVLLVARILWPHEVKWFALGVLGLLPVALFAGWRSQRKLPPAAKLRASYDNLNACGGLIMSAEVADMGAWQNELPTALPPRLRWRSGRAMLFLAVGALFAATAILLPERLTRFASRRSLEIGQVVQQLQAEVQVLQQEKIIEDTKAQDLQKQLAQLQKDSSGFDPGKTWEALDHIKEANSDAASHAAEEALTKTSALAQAETLALAMRQASDAGMSDINASEAAQDLAKMLAAAKLEEGVLNGKIPAELLAGLNGLNKEQMNNLLRAMQFGKNSLGMTISNLAQLKLIDPSMLAKCRLAGQCKNPGALAEYLSTCTNGCNALAECELLGKGGPGGGGPEAPMTWNDGASEKDLKFQQHALPPASQLSDAQLVGVSRAAPDASDSGIIAEHGALDQAAASGGSAHSQVILPEHRQAVRNFFKRDQP